MEITLKEYNRRFDMIMQAYRAGNLTKIEAIDAARELSNALITHAIKGVELLESK